MYTRTHVTAPSLCMYTYIQIAAPSLYMIYLKKLTSPIGTTHRNGKIALQIVREQFSQHKTLVYRESKAVVFTSYLIFPCVYI